jgi:prefoldin beta subunit
MRNSAGQLDPFFHEYVYFIATSTIPVRRQIDFPMVYRKAPMSQTGKVTPMALSIEALERAAKSAEESRAKLQDLVDRRGQVFIQQKECEFVLEAFEFMDETDVVFKQVGPALVKQELGSSMENVTGRLEHIKQSLTDLGQAIQDAQKELTAAEERLQSMQASVK